jgi:hypothetical protein
MSATTTVWPLLAVAGITVVGTLGATILTEWRAARREDAQWKRQRQDRHEEDRKQQYANLINILHAWQSAVDSTRANIAGLDPETEDTEPEIDVRDYWPHRDAARQALAIVDLFASAKVRSLGHSAVEAGEAFSDNIKMIYVVPATELDAASKRFRESRAALTDAMRDDLGLQPEA